MSNARNEAYAKLAQSRNRLATGNMAKQDKEALLREIRAIERLYGIPPRKYNGGFGAV